MSEPKSLDEEEGKMNDTHTVTLDVGGTLFKTTWDTLLLAGKVGMCVNCCAFVFLRMGVRHMHCMHAYTGLPVSRSTRPHACRQDGGVDLL
jgi:hypothetical protein